MMDNEQRQLISKYIDVVIRKKALIAVLFFMSIIGGLFVYLSMPRVYQSAALLSYQQQKVNPSRMSPDVEARIRDMVSTLSQIVTSRTHLEKTIKDLDLFKQMRTKVSMEDVVDMMREKIAITPSERGDTFRISYRGGDPKKVVKVTNALAAKFIEENLKYREERATETSAYTKEELQMAKIVLDKKEAVMRDYKMKYYNEMPEQRISNVERLTSIQMQYQAKQDSIQDLERTKAMVQEQIATRKKIIEQSSLNTEEDDNENREVRLNESARQQLVRMKRKKEMLLLKYTDRHPEIKRINRLIANLEVEAAGEKVDEETTEEEEEPEVLVDSVILQLKLQIKSISLNIEGLEAERILIKEQIGNYEKWVAAAPIREAEWSALTREYGELKRHYDYLVAQNLQAKSVLNLERKQRGSQFKIEDPARLPEKPVKPNFPLIMGAAVAAGLGLGGLLAFGVELLNFSFKDQAELESFLDLPVVCSVPYVKLANEEKRDRQIFILGLILFVLCGIALLGVMAYCWWKGYIII